MPTASTRAEWGRWLLFVAAALGVLVSLYDFFLAWGISHTVGTGIVLVSTAIMAVSALAFLIWRAMPAWLRVLLLIGLALDVIGTGVAAYFLTAWLLLALMVVAAIGWFGTVFSGSGKPREQMA